MWKLIMYDYSTRMYHEYLISGTIDEAAEEARRMEDDPDVILYRIEAA